MGWKIREWSETCTGGTLNNAIWGNNAPGLDRRSDTLLFIDSSMQLIKLAIVQACGAKYRIQGELLDETNVDDVVVGLVNLAAQVSFFVG